MATERWSFQFVRCSKREQRLLKPGQRIGETHVSKHPPHSRSRLFASLLGTAVVLGASAYLVRRQTRKAVAENPPQGRFVMADGVRLHYTEHGSLFHPTVVLIHGNGTMAREMEISGLAKLLATRFRVLVFDRPGYGHSERPEGRSYTPEAQAEILLAAFENLGIVRPMILGHSWGAMVALAMGLRNPERLRALILVAGYYTPTLRLDSPVLGLPALPVIGTLMRHTVSPLLGRLLWPLMMRRVFAPAPTPPGFKDAYPVWMSLRPSQLRASAAEAAMMPVRALKLRCEEHALQLPTMLIAGDKDRLVMTSWQSQRFHERLPQTRLVVVPGSGHMVHHTAPDEVLQAVFEAWHMSSSPVLQTHATATSDACAGEGPVSNGERADVATPADVPT